MLIKEIPVSETYELRHAVLRPGFPRNTVHYEQDRLEGAFHLGVFEGDILICIGSFYKMAHMDPSVAAKIQTHFTEFDPFQTDKIYQLRGMATLSEYRSKGAGSLLLTSAKNILKAKGVSLLWCNAREIAFPFYRNLGFIEVGDFFNSYTIPHKVMFKRIS